MDGARADASEIISKAETRANQIIEDAKGKAKVEADKIVQAAQAEISQEINSARLELKNQLGDLVISGASKILEQEIDQSKHSNIIKNLQSELS